VGGSATDSTVVQVAVGQHTGYDRFVITFGGGVPSYEVTNQKSASFQSGGGKGGIYTLEGSAGVLITVHSIHDWATYSGPTEFLARYPFLREARQIQNYEGYQSWALGIQNGACVRLFTLASPNRLVVDIGAPG